MANDFPEIRDTGTVGAVFQADQFLTIGIEGEMDNDGSATEAVPAVVTSSAQAVSLFGATSNLTKLVNFAFARGIGSVTAVASKKGSAPDLTERQAAWDGLDDNRALRIRLTDSVTQADLAALADACEGAEAIQNKQFCFVSLASASTKDNYLALATAVASKRGVVVGPAIYDVNGTLLGGMYAAAYAACEVAKNPNIVDSLNNAAIPATTGIERDAAGLPLFRLRAGGGTPVNDFQDLLTGGVSPFQQGVDGRAAFTHLRTSYTANDSFDALMTLLIKDEVFIGIRSMLSAEKFLRTGNTKVNRALAVAHVDNFLQQHSDWVEPVLLQDGTTGYGVTATPSSDLKKFTVAFQGQVVRGTNVIDISDTLTIAA